MLLVDSGLDRISNAFVKARLTQKAALMPYYTLGYPDRQTSLEVVESIAETAELLELGIPFSDPIADGPTIQRSSQISLEGGTTTAACLEMVAELRARGIDIPMLLMGYYNPILAYGEARFVQAAADAGADGFIVPDLPPEEADSLREAATGAGLALIHFLAPTSNPKRVKYVLERAKGFIYMVSVTGVTGARGEAPSDIQGFVRGLKSKTDLPVAVGFGISTPMQALAVGEYADGVIVGSALLNAVEKGVDKAGAAQLFVTTIHEALRVVN